MIKVSLVTSLMFLVSCKTTCEQPKSLWSNQYYDDMSIGCLQALGLSPSACECLNSSFKFKYIEQEFELLLTDSEFIKTEVIPSIEKCVHDSM